MGKFFAYLIILSLFIAGCEKSGYENNIPPEKEIIQNKTFPVPHNNQAVDLGLSVKWAPYNIGASMAIESGNYYAWGETNFKDAYTLTTYTKLQINEDGNIINGDYDVAKSKWKWLETPFVYRGEGTVKSLHLERD